MSDDETHWQNFLLEGLLPHKQLVLNALTEVSTISHAGKLFPLTVNLAGAATTSWVTSLRNSYGPYARAETDLVRMHPMLQPIYRAASYVAESLLCVGGLAGGAFANNWLLATNLFPQEMPDLLALRDVTLTRYPDLPVIFRSLTPPLHATLLAKLAAHGFILLPTRQVWITESLSTGYWRRYADVKNDFKLEARAAPDSIWVDGQDFTDTDFQRAVALYNALYREKYPHFNPAYTETFFRIGVSTGWLRLHGLRYAASHALAGIVGVVKRGQVCATPVLGYDLQAPKQQGIYRRLMLKAFLETEKLGNALHCSGGAGAFKLNRGAKPSVEFAAIWMKHLPGYRASSINVLNRITAKFALPYLEKHIL